MQRADRGEVAFVGEVGALAHVHRADQFGDQEIEIGIALAVRVRAHVDRHVVDVDREIGAVVEIVAAQEILVGFALAGVLRDDQAGHGFEHSPGRVTGRALISSPETVIWLAVCSRRRAGADIRRAGAPPSRRRRCRIRRGDEPAFSAGCAPPFRRLPRFRSLRRRLRRHGAASRIR